LLPLLDLKNHTTFEITENFAKIFGNIVFSLNKKNNVMRNKKEFTNFFKEMLIHDEIKIKVMGIYILPCMHLIFKDV
jgi:hypothetical protein